jgi:hypothetical protein
MPELLRKDSSIAKSAREIVEIFFVEIFPSKGGVRPPEIPYCRVKDDRWLELGFRVIE